MFAFRARIIRLISLSKNVLLLNDLAGMVRAVDVRLIIRPVLGTRKILPL